MVRALCTRDGSLSEKEELWVFSQRLNNDDPERKQHAQNIVFCLIVCIMQLKDIRNKKINDGSIRCRTLKEGHRNPQRAS